MTESAPVPRTLSELVRRDKDMFRVRSEIDALSTAVQAPMGKIKKREQLLELRFELGSMMQQLLDKDKLVATFRTSKKIRAFAKEIDQSRKNLDPKLAKAEAEAEKKGDERVASDIRGKRLRALEEEVRQTLEHQRRGTALVGQVYGALERAKKTIDDTLTDLRKLEKSVKTAVRDIQEAYNRQAVQSAMSPRVSLGERADARAQDRLVTSLFRVYDGISRTPTPASEKKKKTRKRKVPAKPRGNAGSPAAKSIKTESED